MCNIRDSVLGRALRSKNNSIMVPCLHHGIHRQPVTVASNGTTVDGGQQINYSEESEKLAVFILKYVAFCLRLRPTVRCSSAVLRRTRPPPAAPPGRLVQHPCRLILCKVTVAALVNAPPLRLLMSSLSSSPLLGPEPLASTARTVGRVPSSPAYSCFLKCRQNRALTLTPRHIFEKSSTWRGYRLPVALFAIESASWQNPLPG